MEIGYTELEKALNKGFIDHMRPALEKYGPDLLTNDYAKKQKVVTSLISELNSCDEFYFAVAFITQSGVATLINTFADLEKKGVKGVIIASEYQKFTQPQALETLLSFNNIELHIVTEDKAKMHTKGYLFKKRNEVTLIAGSSNLTQEALSVNKEWNVRLYSYKDGAIVHKFYEEFEKLKKISTKVTVDWLSEYKKIYAAADSARSKNTEIEQSFIVKPNDMQLRALQSLEDLRDNMGAERAIVVSATGTGKTYLAAFDVAKVRPSRMLFIVHREIIAKDAMASFKRVIGDRFKMGFLGGGQNSDADYIFATVQTISRKDHLVQFKRDDFDYIIIDEVHRAGAKSYKKIFDHFKPKFWLGMSATPERTDNFNIYELFDYNIACEIRLQDAMEENMVVPFHYYGVSELKINDELIDDFTDFKYLVSQNRVEHIIEKVKFYGYSGKRVKGLMFCSRNEEAKELSELFNRYGYNTVALSGANSHEEREIAINRLEQDSREGGLDYIFTVDIFNEGVDIPAINQIVMLRSTQSSIVFVQQLGRGLRNLDNKEFLIVIDFIGNYLNNFLIPIALSGDKSYNKDNLRRIISEGNAIIPGASTVNFEPVVKEVIYKAIDNANFGEIKVIRDAYFELKNKVGKIPSMLEFLHFGLIDLNKMFMNPQLKSYHNFLKKYDPEYDVILSETEELYLEFLSHQFGAGKRPHELEYIKILVKGSCNIDSDFISLMNEKYSDIRIDDNTFKAMYNQLTQKYLVGQIKKTYEKVVFLSDDLKSISSSFAVLLESDKFREMLLEIIEYALELCGEKYNERYRSTNFNLYKKYTYSDVVRLLDWDTAQVAQNIGGYKYHEPTRTFPVFINYDKDEENIVASINYKDRFLSPEYLIAISKSNRNITSPEVETFVNAAKKDIKIPLFIRKNKDDKESKEFYFLGEIVHDNSHLKAIEMQDIVNGKKHKAVEIGYLLETPVRQDLYEYLIS